MKHQSRAELGSGLTWILPLGSHTASPRKLHVWRAFGCSQFKIPALTSELASKGRQRWSNQPRWISPRAGQALLIWLWPIKPALSLPTLPLDVTDSQKPGRKDTAVPKMPKNTQGPAFCWSCRQEGQSQPGTCTHHSEQRGRVQHLLEGRFNHLQGTRLQVTAFSSSLKIRTCTVSHHKMKSLLPSRTLTAIISSPSNSTGKL